MKWGEEEKVCVLVDDEGVKKAVEELMGDGDDAKERRRRAKELGKLSNRAIVQHAVLGDIWVHLELKRGDKGDHWTSSPWERSYRSDTMNSLCPTSQSDLTSELGVMSPQRHPDVAPRPIQVPMVKKTKGKLDAEKQEAERKEYALRGKVLASKLAGFGTQRTSRQQTLAAKKLKEQEKRAGKSVAVPTNEENDDESEDELAPTKKAKMSKGKAVVVDRDMEKTPSVEELYDHLLNGVTWTPTRFADLDLLKELGLDSDIEAMLGHLKMSKLLTMAYPVYKDVSCQFLSSLEVTYHNTPHVRKGWGKIKFKVNGRDYNMNFKDIGRVMGFQDLEDYSLPKCENLPTELWKLITGNRHSTGTDKNSHIRRPSVRYLHRMLIHAFYPRKEACNVTEEDMRLLCPAIRSYAAPGVLPLPSTDIYATFGMVGHGGLITPLLQFMNVPLGKDAAGPRFIDGTYLRIATYFSGMYGKNYVYYYYLKGKPIEVVLPNKNLTSLERPRAMSFNISQEDFLGEHGYLGPIAAPRKRSTPTRHDEPAAEASEPVYGPPRYYFKPYAGFLPPGALRDTHEHIGRLQRWNKAQDKTIEKLKDKCKALSKTVKKQAKTSAKFMKKVADVLTRGGIAGCSSADFAFANTSVPQPPPQPADLGFPLTARQL
uniref:Arabidopsis retrotransposon Orf1 C-terminal domain-containing protein n=1 Tax=Brassica oleracea var. oleracea TaxID=109376 RepID=A0A0D3BRE1_BRAOL